MEEFIKDSIELLQRQERLALKYSEDGYYLAFSGGKDSQCIYHLAEMAGVKFKAHMNFTSVDPPEVIRFVREYYPNVITHKPIDSIYNIAVKQHKGLPTRIRRWCCAELKEKGGAGTVTITGVRKAESVKRKAREEIELSSHKFKGSRYEFDNFVYDNSGIDSLITCVNGKDKVIINPIVKWSDKQVWHFLNDIAKVPHCVLYDKGYKRIGCIACPLATKRKIIADINRYPHVKKLWVQAIKEIRKENYSENIITKGNWGEGDEDEIAERIFNYWIGKDSYKKWFADNIKQIKLSFR